MKKKPIKEIMKFISKYKFRLQVFFFQKIKVACLFGMLFMGITRKIVHNMQRTNLMFADSVDRDIIVYCF